MSVVRQILDTVRKLTCQKKSQGECVKKKKKKKITTEIKVASS